MAKARIHPVVRITHWVNVVALTIMIGSGLRIFNAYPAFAREGRDVLLLSVGGARRYRPLSRSAAGSRARGTGTSR